MREKPITYYFRSGAIEGVLAFVLMLLIPADPKNSWILGFSRTRLLSLLILGLLALSFLYLANLSLRKPKFTEKISLILDFIFDLYGFSLPVLLLITGLFILWPYLKLFTLLPFEEVKIRLLPFILYLAARYFQSILVVIVMLGTRRKQGIRWEFSRRNLVTILLTIIGILVAAHLSIFIIHQITRGSIRYREVWQLNKYFNLTYEMNIPSFFSSLLLGSAGFILLVIALKRIRQHARFGFQWFCLSILFFYLSADEWLALHENLGYYATDYFGKENLVIQDWAYAGIVLVILFAVVFWPFYRHLPSGHKFRFFVSAVLYLGGVLGMEIIGSIYEIRLGYQEIPYLIFTTIEETLEMVGMVYFINALLLYWAEIKTKPEETSTHGITNKVKME